MPSIEIIFLAIVFKFLLSVVKSFTLIASIIVIYLVKLEYPLMYHLEKGVLEVLGNDLLSLLLIILMYVSQNLFNLLSDNCPFKISYNNTSKIPFTKLLLLIFT